MFDKKVIIITTGGTIAMSHDDKTGGLIPTVSGADLIEAVPPLKTICDIDVIEFANVPSPHMTPQMMKNLGDIVDKTLAQDDVAGVVITHGTDTLEETAFFLDLYVKSDKPVCLTASMRAASEMSPDGPKNIFCAVRTAFHKESANYGTLVVMNEEIHAARDVTKTHSSSVAAFSSPFWGPLGYVDEDRVIFHRLPPTRTKIHPEKINDDVYLIKAFTGMPEDIFSLLVDKKISGLVVEGFGRGNVPVTAARGIEKVLRAGMPVVLSSRVSGGRVLDVYAYDGSATKLKEAGVIFANGLNGQKARIMLMLGLGVTKSTDELNNYFAHNS